MIHVMSSPTSSSYTSFGISASPSSTSCSSQLLTANSLEGAPSSQDMKYNQPMRKCLSLTKLPSGSDGSSTRTLCYQYSQGSLDRGLLYGHRKTPIGSNMGIYLPLSSSLLCNSWLKCSPGAGPCSWYNHSSRYSALETDLSSALASPVKCSNLDMKHSALPEAEPAHRDGQIYTLCTHVDSLPGNQTDRGSPIQTSVNTQVWLTEQMDYRLKAIHGVKPGQICTGTESCSADGLSPSQQGHQQETTFEKVRLCMCR